MPCNADFHGSTIELECGASGLEINSKEVYHMKKLDVIVAVLLVIGGLNWGLVGLSKFDAVQISSAMAHL